MASNSLGREEGGGSCASFYNYHTVHKVTDKEMPAYMFAATCVCVCVWRFGLVHLLLFGEFS